ncbi:hypothetical protein Esti_003860 [Eimeria stiedai]
MVGLTTLSALVQRLLLPLPLLLLHTNVLKEAAAAAAPLGASPLQGLHPSAARPHQQQQLLQQQRLLQQQLLQQQRLLQQQLLQQQRLLQQQLQHQQQPQPHWVRIDVAKCRPSWLHLEARCSSDGRSSTRNKISSSSRKLLPRRRRGSSLSVASVAFDEDAQARQEAPTLGASAETLRHAQQQQQQRQHRPAFGSPKGAPSGTPTPPPDLPSALLQRNTMLLGGPLSAEASRLLASQLLHLGASGTSEATLYINSPGYEADGQGGLLGADLEWLSVASLLLQHQTTTAAAAAAAQQRQRLQVATIALGHAGGPAALLLACGARGRRFATPNTWVSLKAPPTCCSGTSAALRTRAEAALEDRELFIRLLLHATQQQQQQQQEQQQEQQQQQQQQRERQIRRLVVEGGALDAQEAKALGLIDEVLE